MRPGPTLTMILMTAALPAQRATKEVLAAVDALVAVATTPEQRAEAYGIVLSSPFAQVAGPLTRAKELFRVRQGHNLFLAGIGPRTETPWLETAFRVERRIDFTIGKLCWELSRRAQWPEAMRTVLEVLEDPSGGESRGWVLPQHQGAIREAAKAVPDVQERLEKIARVDKVPWIRARACLLLAQEGEKPEALIDLAFEIAGTEAMPVHQADLLGQTGIIQALPRM